jgi:hypothetical protein
MNDIFEQINWWYLYSGSLFRSRLSFLILGISPQGSAEFELVICKIRWLSAVIAFAGTLHHEEKTNEMGVEVMEYKMPSIPLAIRLREINSRTQHNHVYQDFRSRRSLGWLRCSQH